MQWPVEQRNSSLAHVSSARGHSNQNIAYRTYYAHMYMNVYIMYLHVVSYTPCHGSNHVQYACSTNWDSQTKRTKVKQWLVTLSGSQTQKQKSIASTRALTTTQFVRVIIAVRVTIARPAHVNALTGSAHELGQRATAKCSVCSEKMHNILQHLFTRRKFSDKSRTPDMCTVHVVQNDM